MTIAWKRNPLIVSVQAALTAIDGHSHHTGGACVCDEQYRFLGTRTRKLLRILEETHTELAAANTAFEFAEAALAEAQQAKATETAEATAVLLAHVADSPTPGPLVDAEGMKWTWHPAGYLREDDGEPLSRAEVDANYNTVELPAVAS